MAGRGKEPFGADPRECESINGRERFTVGWHGFASLNFLYEVDYLL
jgi:hypothetical protein